jgi:hypothetical protein
MDNHIVDILDNTPFTALSAGDLNTIQAHTSICADCADALEAARLSSLLLHERVSDAAEQAANANPFFQTRVLAAWHEQQTSGAWGFRRLWNATGALVASMAATTAALAVLMFVAPATNTTSTDQTAALVPYSAESVVLEQDDNQLTNDQIISAIYDDDDEGK